MSAIDINVSPKYAVTNSGKVLSPSEYIAGTPHYPGELDSVNIKICKKGIEQEFNIMTKDITYSDGGDNYLLDPDGFTEKIKDLVVFIITNIKTIGEN